MSDADQSGSDDGTESPRERISGTLVKRTDDGRPYHLEPHERGQIHLQPTTSDDTAPSDDDALTVSMGQFRLLIQGGEYYFPRADTGVMLDAVRAVRPDPV